MIGISVCFFIFNYNSTHSGTGQKYQLVNIGAIILVVLAAIVGLLVILIQSELGSASCQTLAYQSLIWVPTALLFLLAIGFAYYRYKNKNTVELKKNDDVNWLLDEARLNFVAKQQFDQCGYKEVLDNNPKLPLALLRNFASKTDDRNILSKLVSSRKLPKDKIPNLVKMFEEFSTLQKFTPANSNKILANSLKIRQQPVAPVAQEA